MLWLATMSWLVTEKVLPLLWIGEPPSYSRIVEAQKDAPPVGWRILLDDRPLGWALSQTKLQKTGLTDIRGWVHFDALPLEEMMPGWRRVLSPLIERLIEQPQMDAWSVLTIDPLGHLVRFDSAVRLDPLKELIRVRGAVEGQQLDLTFRSGEVSFSSEAFLPSDSLLCDALSPQTQLPGLRVGQEWTVPVYSPLRPAKSPLEIIHAKVERREPIFWSGVMKDCWLVVYRSDTTGLPGDSQVPRGKLWVRRDGMVLKQQVLLFDATINFERLSEEEAFAIARDAGPQWWDWESELLSEARNPRWEGIPTAAPRRDPEQN